MRKDVDFLADKKVNRDLLGFSPLNQGLIGIVRRDVKYLQLKGLLDYSLLLSVEKSEETYDREKIIAKKKASDALLGRKTKYWKGVNAAESHMLDRRFSGKTHVNQKNLSFHQQIDSR